MFDTEQHKLIIEILKGQLLSELIHDDEAFSAQIEDTRNAMRTILMERDGQLHVEFDYGDGVSRFDITVTIDAKVTFDEQIPDYLPADIFIQLHGQSVERMMSILRAYNMPEDEIKPFLRRLIPADDSY